MDNDRGRLSQVVTYKIGFRQRGHGQDMENGTFIRPRRWSHLEQEEVASLAMVNRILYCGIK